jgi:regulator of protease activity HflC (stomatin/prohibitin superfamily)
VGLIEKLLEKISDLLQLLLFFTVLEPFQGGVVVTLGKKVREIGPGFHFKWPLNIDVVHTANVVKETMIVGPQFLMTRDDVQVGITCVVTFRIVDIGIFLLDVEGANQVVNDSTLGTISDCVMRNTYPKLRAGSLAAHLTKSTRNRALSYGVGIESVKIKDFTRLRTYGVIEGDHRKVHPA